MSLLSETRRLNFQQNCLVKFAFSLCDHFCTGEKARRENFSREVDRMAYQSKVLRAPRQL